MSKDQKKSKREEAAEIKEILPGASASDVIKFLNKDQGASVAVSNTSAMFEDVKNMRSYSTGILSLDHYLGCGGMIPGRIFNMAGWQGAGKTLTAMLIGGYIQRSGGRFAYCDAEGTFSPTLAKSVGVDVDNLILIRSSPEKILFAEDYFEIIRTLVQMGVEFILVDSLPALVPSAKAIARLGEGRMMQEAQIFSEAFSAITPVMSAFNKSILYVINQMRAVPMNMFGPDSKHTGGNALLFFESYSLEVKKEEDIKAKVVAGSGRIEEQRIGARVRAKLVKNKTSAIPVDPITYTVYFGDYKGQDGTEYRAGIDVIADALDVGVNAGVIKQSGSWYEYGGIKGNGMDDMRRKVREAVIGGSTILDSLRAEVIGGVDQSKGRAKKE